MNTVTETVESQAQDAGGRRGRPRPQETLERDNQVKTQLASGPKTTQELAEALGIETGIAYLCIYRLKRAGEVEKVQAESGGRNPAWKLVG